MTTKTVLFTLIAVLAAGTRLLQAADEGPLANAERAEFHGFTEYRFIAADDLSCRLVVPRSAAPGNPWIWRARFFGHEPQTDVALLEAGFHVAYCDVANLFGNPQAVDRWNRFYDFATTTLGLGTKPALEGMSRGGLIIFNWAAANPDKVACIYGDAPVCSLLSWPLAQAQPGKSNAVVDACLAAYGFPSLEAFKAAPPKGPLDRLGPLAENKIPVLLVCGLADDIVPYEDNGKLLATRYRELGGPVEVIEKPGVGHHPHSLKDPAPIVKFIRKHAAPET